MVYFDYVICDEKIAITNYTGRWWATGGDVVVPESIDDIPVTTIGRIAFNGCTGLISITLPNSLTTIGDYAFSGCTGLLSITLPDSFTTIGRGAFQDCPATITFRKK